MLFSMLIHTESFKVNVSTRTKLWLHGPGDVNGAFEAQVGHAVPENLEVDGNHTSHFDGAAKRNLAVTLRKVQITD